MNINGTNRLFCISIAQTWSSVHFRDPIKHNPSFCQPNPTHWHSNNHDPIQSNPSMNKHCHAAIPQMFSSEHGRQRDNKRQTTYYDNANYTVRLNSNHYSDVIHYSDVTILHNYTSTVGKQWFAVQNRQLTVWLNQTQLNPVHGWTQPMTMSRVAESLHGLSQTLIQWSSRQPNAINTRLQPLSAFTCI